MRKCITHITRFISILVLVNIISVQGVIGAPIKEQSSGDIYLPLIKNSSRLITNFGIEIDIPYDTIVMDSAEASGAYWVRNMAFSWAEIEPTRTNPPTYNWNAVDEVGLQNIKNKNLKTIAVIYHTPSWAQKISGKICGPIASDDLDAFSQFVQAVVARYGFSSYNIKYWEFINEPDAAWNDVPMPDNPFGCWGDDSDLDYFGGDYYAEMLKVAYPAVKAADPNAQVLLGGLLLDCDPTYQPLGVTCPHGHFFRGVLSNGGGPYFDIVNYHAYPYKNNGKIHDQDHYKWGHTRGIILGKLDFLKSVMLEFSINKPIIITEAALICSAHWMDCDDDLPAFYEDQADYVMRLYSAIQTESLLGTIWYILEGNSFFESNLLYPNYNQKPAYIAYQFMTQEMKGTTALGESTEYPEVTTYKFSASDIQIWVMWASDQEDKSISLPSNTIQVLDKYGNILYTNPVPDPITINRPIYVELPK